MKNDAYWQRRFEAIENSSHRAAQATITHMERTIANAQRELEGRISVWYNRFAVNNEISLVDAKRLLNSRELEEFKWDVNQYIQYGRENAISGQWVKQLENASARFHISRLEALKFQTQNAIEQLFGNQLDTVDALMRRQYLDGYYHSIFEVQKGFNVGWGIAAVDDRRLNAIMNKPWTTDNRTFSDRIWRDKEKLTRELHNSLTQNVILGKPPHEILDQFSKKMGTTRNNAARLINTESSYFSALAEKDAYRELEVEQYKVLATLDSKTSDRCREMDGKVFDTKDFQPGITANPFHVNCRTTTVPYFDDDFGERAARGADGKTYYVPSNMKYPEWKAKFVDGDDLQKTAVNGTMNVGTFSSYEEAKKALEAKGVKLDESLKKLDENLLLENTSKLNELLEKYPAAQQYARDNSFTLDAKALGGSNTIGQCSYRYDGSQQTITLNPKFFAGYEDYVKSQMSQIQTNWKMPVTNANLSSYTVTHEFGHYIENIIINNYRTSHLDEWNAIWTKAMSSPSPRKNLGSWYRNQANNIRKKIVSIAHDMDSNINLRSYQELISDYGKSSPQEFFAECFANLEGGDANLLGRAMEEYLKGAFD